MNFTKSSVRYATALLDLCLEQGKVEEVEADLIRFTVMLSGSKELKILFSSPVIRDDKKMAIYKMLFEEFNPITISFFNLVTKNGREHLLPEIAHQFDRLLKKQRNIVTGTITSSIALDAKTKQSILDKIASTFEGTLALDEVVNESLLGGFIIRIDDKQIDASVSSKLKTMKQELVK